MFSAILTTVAMAFFINMEVRSIYFKGMALAYGDAEKSVLGSEENNEQPSSLMSSSKLLKLFGTILQKCFSRCTSG